jgi:phosphoribosylglycinamide formyltransferase-1
VTDDRQRVVVLGSGIGTNFEALAEQAEARYQIVAVGSERTGAPILERARRRGIEAFAVSPADYPDKSAHDAALATAISRHRPDWIALAGYMRLLGSETLASRPGRILNVHPALLPEFPGLDTHRRALAARAREHGATVHFVTAALDAGPTILQARLAVGANDTTQSLRSRVQALEHVIYPRALAWCAAGRAEMREGATWLDGKPLLNPLAINETDLL